MFFQLDNLVPNALCGDDIKVHTTQYPMTDPQWNVSKRCWRVYELLDIKPVGGFSGYNFDTQVNLDVSIVSVSRNIHSPVYILMISDPYNDWRDVGFFNLTNKESNRITFFFTGEDAMAGAELAFNALGFEIDRCSLSGIANNFNWN